MTTYHLPRTGLPALSFDGRLRVETLGEDPDEATEGRIHDIRVYEADDGQFIVSVDYQSPFDSELSDHMVDAVDSVDEVDAVLSLYEATERVDPQLFVDRESRLHALQSTLTTRFDKQVSAVLDALQVSHV